MLRPLVLALALSTFASGTSAAAQPAGESVLTLRIDGELSIDPAGKVMDYRITTKLDPQVEKMVRRAVPGWRFKPIEVDGKPVIATSPMRITLAATEVEQGYRVKVDNVVFRPNTREEYEAEKASRKAHPRMSVAGETPSTPVWITSRSMPPPRYPAGLQRSGVEGIVLLSLRLNPDGSVAEVFATQSSLLNVTGRPGLLERARVVLEQNASDNAKRWTFDVTTEEPASLTASALTVHVPVDYRMEPPGEGAGKLTGTWRHEYRGPNLPPPWLATDSAAKIGVSDLAGNEIQAGVSPFQLSDKSVIGKTL